jgi:diguanylate cyclase (GGDEF)-like protein
MFEQLPSVAERNAGNVVRDALFVVDVASGMLTYVNAEAATLFAVRTEDLARIRASDLIPDLASLDERSFAATIGPDGDRRDIEVAVVNLSGRAEDVRLVTVRASVTAEIEAQRAREKRSERLESLWTLVVRRGFAGNEAVRAILREAVRGIGLERATVARVEPGELTVEFADAEERIGTRTPIETSLERRAVAGSGSFAVLDTATDSEFDGLSAETRSFLTCAFRVGETRYVLTFASARPRVEPFGDSEWIYVDDVVEAVSRGIERRASDERIERLAYFDALTSLPNRIALHARLDEAIADAGRTAGRAAVLFLDIDGFKGVNDTVGHRGGDVVLAEVAQRLRGTLRRDEYIGRLGGDEFAIVIPAVADRAEIESIANRVGGVLSFPFGIDGYRFSLSASIGVAIYPDDAGTRDDLLACADAAMYAAKDDGGSRVRFRDLLGDRGEPSFSTRSALAGEPRDVGYVLCYQPILELRSGAVTAAEALIRRIHPVHGLLAPERGWSIAHEPAGRRALDRWVLREALAQAQAWDRAGRPIRIDVNLAAFDPLEIDALLADERFAGDVRRLRIEVSSRLFEESEAGRVSRFVEHCAQNGIALVLDGFEGGLGDVASLSHLPIEALKLERSLVEGITVSRTSRAIVEGTILVARSLGWSVIAKGAETSAQFDALVALGCDAMQGFHVSQPLTASEFGNWLSTRDARVGRPA